MRRVGLEKTSRDFAPRARYAGCQGRCGLKVLYIDELLLVNFAAGAAFLASRGLDRELRFDLVVVSGPERRIDYYPEIIDLF